jgi:hypothetical protein
MEAFFWATLAFLLLAGIAGGTFAGLRAWRAWQAFTSLAAGGGAGTERLIAGAERLMAHTGRATAGVEELTAATARLQRALARGRILLGATGEVLDLLRALRALAPQK